MNSDYLIREQETGSFMMICIDPSAVTASIAIPAALENTYIVNVHVKYLLCFVYISKKQHATGCELFLYEI